MDNESSFFPKPEVETNAQIERDIEDILTLQKKWPEAVTEKSPDFIRNLYQKNLIVIARNEQGDIIGSFYKQPLNLDVGLDSSEQIYRWGGFSNTGTKEAKKQLIDLFKSQTEEAISKGIRVIFKTDVERAAEMLKESSWIEMTYEECRKNHPLELALYIKNSSKPEEYYFDKIFYFLSN